MPLTAEQESYIVDKTVEILRATNKQERIAALREQVISESSMPLTDDDSNLDAAVYSVLQAIEELYGT